MSSNMLLYVIYGVGGIFVFIVVAFLVLNKKMGKSDYQKIKKLRKGTESDRFSSEIMYQKIYITFSKIPFLKSYLLKLRRRLEIINVDDEYATRRDSAKNIIKNINNFNSNNDCFNYTCTYKLLIIINNINF